VNKTELIEHIANNADISKAAAARALESTIEAVKKTLKKAAPCRSSVSVPCRGQARCTHGPQPPYRITDCP